MSFFDPAPDEPEWLPQPIEPRRRRWRGTPDDTLGAAIALSVVVAHTDEVAVLVSGIVAFPIGFSFSLVALSRTGAASMDVWRHGPNPHPAGVLQFGLQFSDGLKATNRLDHGYHPDGTGQPRLMHAGGGSGGRKCSQRYTCWPLPPSGPLTFVVAWPDNDLDETRVEVDADLIRQPGLAAAPLWPEDVDYDEPAAEHEGFDRFDWPNGGGQRIIASQPIDSPPE